MEGWIKLHRKLLDHWIWVNEKYLRAWIWFLMRANHTNTKVLFGNELIDIKRGEFITSINNISLATELTSQNVRTFIRLLENDKMINKQSTNKLTKITICNYDKYNVNQQATNKQTNKQTTSSQQAANKRVTTDNNVLKKDKNEKKIEYADTVFLLKNEYNKLIKDHGNDNTNLFISVLDNYKGSNGKKYKSDYKAILSWVIDKTKKENKYKSKTIPLSA